MASESPENSPPIAGSLPRNVRLLGIASLLNDVASEMIFPLMPQFLLSVIGGTHLHLGVIEGVADTVASLLKLWSGAWSDRAGRRKRFVVIGYTLAALTRPLVGIASAYWQVFGIRIADRIGKGIRTAPRDALIAESTPRDMKGRAFGFHRAMDHLGAAIGPLLASAFLLAWPGQLRTLFLITLLPGAAVVLLVIWGLREPRSQTTSPAPIRLSLRPFDRNFRTFLLALVIFTLGNSSDAFLLVRAGELGVPTAMLPLLWCVFHVVKSLGNLIAGRAVDKVGPRPLMFGGWALYAAIYLAFAFANATWHVWVLFLLYGLFYALTEPAAKTLVTLLAASEHQGLAFGWFNFAIGIAALPSSVIFGWLYASHGSLTAFSWGAILAAASALILLNVQLADQTQSNNAPTSDHDRENPNSLA